MIYWFIDCILTLILGLLLRKSSKNFSEYLFFRIIINIVSTWISISLLPGYSKPYVGFDFVIFGIRNCLYLLDLPLIGYFLSKEIQKPSLWHLNLGFWVAVSLGFLVRYPSLRGEALITYFHLYIGLMTVVTLIALLWHTLKDMTMTFTETLFFGWLFYTLANLLIYFLYPTWVYIQIVNLIFYALILLFCLISSRQKPKV